MKRIAMPGYNLANLDKILYSNYPPIGSPTPPPGSELRITDSFDFRELDNGNFRITD